MVDVARRPFVAETRALAAVSPVTARDAAAKGPATLAVVRFAPYATRFPATTFPARRLVYAAVTNIDALAYDEVDRNSNSPFWYTMTTLAVPLGCWKNMPVGRAMPFAFKTATGSVTYS